MKICQESFNPEGVSRKPSPSMSEQLISAIMNGAKKLSKSMMVKLHEGLGIPYENMMEIPTTPRYRKVAMF